MAGVLLLAAKGREYSSFSLHNKGDLLLTTEYTEEAREEQGV